MLWRLQTRYFGFQLLFVNTIMRIGASKLWTKSQSIPGVLNILKNEVIDVNLEQFAKLFFVLLTLGAIYIIPILLADRNYIDDFGHSIWGNTWWEWDGRPITSWVTLILNFQYPWSSPWTNNVLVDTGPLFQILSVAILAFIAALLCVRMFNERINYGAALVVFPIIGSPFFLENLSYRFDSLPMSLAVAFAIFAAINLKNKKLDVIVGSLCLTTAFGLYQVSVNVFIGTSALLILADRWAGADKAAALRLFLSNAAKFAIACFVSKIFLLTAYPAFDRAEMISLDKGGLIQLIGTLRESFKVDSEFFLDVPLLSIAAIVSITAFGVRFAIRGAKQGPGILNIFIFVAATLTLAFSIYGPLGFLKHPVLSPRVFMGFAIVLIFILFCYRSTFSGNSEATELFLILPTYYLFFIAFAYGSAAKAQTEYDNHLLSSMVQNLGNNHCPTDS